MGDQVGVQRYPLQSFTGSGPLLSSFTDILESPRWAEQYGASMPELAERTEAGLPEGLSLYRVPHNKSWCAKVLKISPP